MVAADGARASAWIERTHAARASALVGAGEGGEEAGSALPSAAERERERARIQPCRNLHWLTETSMASPWVKSCPRLSIAMATSLRFGLLAGTSGLERRGERKEGRGGGGATDQSHARAHAHPPTHPPTYNLHRRHKRTRGHGSTHTQRDAYNRIDNDTLIHARWTHP